MRFRFIPLEERIVLDAAGASDVINSYDLEHHTIDNQDSHVEKSLADSTVDHHMLDHSVPSEASPTRVLVISSDVKDAPILQNAALSSVLTVYYDPAKTSLQDLSNQISKALGGRQADSIAFVSEGQAGQIHLLNGTDVSLQTLN